VIDLNSRRVGSREQNVSLNICHNSFITGSTSIYVYENMIINRQSKRYTAIQWICLQVQCRMMSLINDPWAGLPGYCFWLCLLFSYIAQNTQVKLYELSRFYSWNNILWHYNSMRNKKCSKLLQLIFCLVSLFLFLRDFTMRQIAINVVGIDNWEDMTWIVVEFCDVHNNEPWFKISRWWYV